MLQKIQIIPRRENPFSTRDETWVSVDKTRGFPRSPRGCGKMHCLSPQIPANYPQGFEHDQTYHLGVGLIHPA